MSRLQSAVGRVPQTWSFGQWPLRRKLAAALALPLILAFVFGGLRVKSDADSASALSRAADTVKVIRPVVAYNDAVQRLAAAESVGGGGVIAAITKYESAAADLRIAIKPPGVPASVKQSAEAALALGQTVRAAKTQNGFSDIVIDKSANTASLMSAAVADLGLSNDSDSAKLVVGLQDTIAAQRAMTGQQLNLANTDDGSASLRAIGQVGAETAALTRLQSESSGSQTQIRQLLNENGRRAYTLQQAAPSRAEVNGLGPVFQSSNTGYSGLMDSQLQALETNLRDRAATHRSVAALNAGFIAAALVAALMIVFRLIRSLLNPIRAVREGALDVAQKRLPDAVARIRDGEEPPEFEPIPVYTTEEMGQLARAVDDLHSQALSLAGDQARLRVQVGHMFETLSRRSTSLIDQQLSLIERLESDEEDPKRLQSLFRLDHLAARMRRNSDSLLVLAGTSTRRGVSGSIAVSDAIRAAVSEVENYERIDIGETSTDHVLGAVGSDLIHLVAEVVDNALAYSPPTSRVAIRGARTPEGGLLIEVSDRGLGMPPKELAALNDRLAHGGDITADTARRMGLFVVGSLAKRHGIAVRLRKNGEDKDRQGITVSIHLPAGLLADTATVRPERPAARAGAGPVTDASPTLETTAPPTSAVGGTTRSGLPTRVRGASGAPSTPIPGAAKKVLPTRPPGSHGPGVPGSALPAKPVIETVGTPSAGAQPPAVNGHTPADDETSGASPVNGVNGHAAAVTDEDATVETAVDQPVLNGHAVEDGAVAPEAAEADEAPAQSSAGLPKRQPRASRITEYREFEDAPASADQDGATAESSAATDVTAPRSSRLTSWLPGRKAAAEAAARAEAEAAADQPRQMPSNLSAWLEHRARLVEAAKERGLAAPAPQDGEGGSDAQDLREGDFVEVAEYPQFVEVADPTQAAEPVEAQDGPQAVPDEMHVPDEWVAEVVAELDGHADTPGGDWSPGQDAEPFAAPEGELSGHPTTPSPDAVDDHVGGLPTRVPGTSGAPTEGAPTKEVPSQESPAVAPTGKARRAHASSFFGARKARETKETEAVEVPVALETSLVPVALEASQVLETVDVPEAVEAVEVPEAPAAQADEDLEVVAEQDEPVEVVAEQDEPVEVVAEQAEQTEVEVVAHTVEEAQPVADELEPQAAELAAPEAEEAELIVEALETVAEPVAEADAEPRPGSNLNDTPIFRAMMSRWLTDEPAPDTDDSAWSPTEADAAWSAAARIEESQPYEESSAGLPKRRPGSFLIPGAIENVDAPDAAAAPAVNRRDPEAIRRRLNRHQQGVSNARTEAQDGNHREEADVHH